MLRFVGTNCIDVDVRAASGYVLGKIHANLVFQESSLIRPSQPRLLEDRHIHEGGVDVVPALD